MPTRVEDSSFSAQSAVVNKPSNYIYKVILVGDSGVGKSCLMKRWVFEEFHTTTSTICADTQTKSYDVKGEVVTFQIWDTAGQEKFRSMTNNYYRGAHGVIIVYDVTYYKSFDSVKRWLEDVESTSSHDAPPVVLLIGNKTDANGRAVSTIQGKALAQSQDLYFMETSALTGNAVQSSIQILMQEIHKNKELYCRDNTDSAGDVGLLSQKRDKIIITPQDSKKPESVGNRDDNNNYECC